MRVLLTGLILLLMTVALAWAQDDAPVVEDALRASFIAEGDVVTAIAGPDDVPLELANCVELALDSNESLRQQREGLAELEGRKTQAISTGLPRIEVQGAFSRGRDPSFAFDESFAGSGSDPYQPIYDYVDPLFQATGVTPPEVEPASASFLPAPEDIPAQTFWRTYLDGYWELRPTQVWRAVSAADDAIQQQQARVSDTANRTIESVIQAYHGLVLAQERVAAVETELEARREFLEVTRRRYVLEFATPLDTLQAAVSLANLQPELRRRQFDLRRAAQGLNQLLGRDPMTPVSVVATFPIEDESVDEQMALSLAARRPDLLALESQTRIYELQRGVASAERHPYLSAEAQWGFVTRDLGELTDQGHDFWRVGLTLHIPIFTALSPRGQIREAEARMRRNESQVRALRREVRDEVIVALGDLEIARADLDAAELNMRQAEDAYNQVSLRYELGKADRLEVLNAQTARFVARTTLIEARYEVLASTATLKRAVGISPAQALASIPELAQALTEGEER
jgi:outer membrane protein TolC